MLCKQVRRINFSMKSFNFSKFTFCNRNSIGSFNLVDTLNSEIKNSENSYVAPDQNEKESFLNKNRWVLFEQENSIKLGLKKSQGEFDVSIIFSSKAPEQLVDQKDPTGK